MSVRDPIEYLINAMEHAAQQQTPAEHDYAGEAEGRDRCESRSAAPCVPTGWRARPRCGF